MVLFALMAFAYLLFTFSAKEYEHFSWYYWLLYSRVFCLALALTLLVLVANKKILNPYVDTIYLTFCLWVQSSHGAMEPPETAEFYSFTGVLFLTSALSAKVSFSFWSKRFLPIHFIGILFPLLFKEPSFFSGIGVFVDSFSLPIVGIVLGCIIAKINTSRFELLNENLALHKKMLLEEKTSKKKISCELEQARKRIQEESLSAAIGSIARQVAHDIRSPLTALDMALHNTEGLAEEKRVLIRKASQRIHDIANNLLNISKKKPIDSSEGDVEPARKGCSVQLVSSIVDPLISEKREQFRTKMNLEIRFSLKADSYGIFAKTNASELSRILSNLVNNSVEAIGKEEGLITVGLGPYDEKFFELYVEDNGIGIPKAIQSRIGERGFSFGKSEGESGSGLGVFHAKTMVEKWGGRLVVESSEGIGSKLSLVLPLASQPSWFVEKLNVSREMKVVVVDDDTSIHQTWEQRFRDTGQESFDRIYHFSKPDDLEYWADSNDTTKALFLCDYELIGSSRTGLDLIRDLNICSRSILVTSRSLDKDVLSRCKKLDVKCLPKELAGIVPIFPAHV